MAESCEHLYPILEDRLQAVRAPTEVVCTLCDAKISPGTPCLLMRASINLLITKKIVEEYACSRCADLIGNRILFLVGQIRRVTNGG